MHAESKLITQLYLYDNDSTFRYFYLYNNEGVKVLETCAYLRKDNVWVNKSQTEWIIYNDLDHKQVERVWTANRWVDRYTIVCDEFEGVRSERHYAGDEDDSKLIRLIESKYKGGQLVLQKRYSIYEASLLMTDSIVYEYELDRLRSSVTKSYSVDRSFQIYKDSFSYYPDAKLKQHTHLLKIGVGSWENSLSTTWYYHPHHGEVSSQRVKTWNKQEQVWENSQMYSNVYDSKGMLLEEKSYVWGMMTWAESTRYIYDYYEDGMLRKKSLYVPIYNQWRNFSNINYADVVSNEQIEIVSVYGFWGGTKDAAVSTDIPFIFNGESNIKKAQKLKLLYSDFTVVSELKGRDPENILLYPNPSSGVFYFDHQHYQLDSWSVLSISGSTLLESERGFNSGVVDISHLPQGVYFLKAVNHDRIVTQKLIKN